LSLPDPPASFAKQVAFRGWLAAASEKAKAYFGWVVPRVGTPVVEPSPASVYTFVVPAHVVSWTLEKTLTFVVPAQITSFVR
jgi:hypothetical protein